MSNLRSWTEDVGLRKISTGNPYTGALQTECGRRLKKQRNMREDRKKIQDSQSERELTALTALDLNYFWELDSQIIINNFSGRACMSYSLMVCFVQCIQSQTHQYTILSLIVHCCCFTFDLENFHKHFHKVKWKAKNFPSHFAAVHLSHSCSYFLGNCNVHMPAFYCLV